MKTAEAFIEEEIGPEPEPGGKLTAEAFLEQEIGPDATLERRLSAEEFLAEAGREPVGTFGGLVAAGKRGLLTTQALPDVALLAATAKRRGPTILQQWRAFQRAMQNPVYHEALTRNWNNPERLRSIEAAIGPAAQLKLQTQGPEAARKALVEDVAAQQQRVGNIPRSAAQERLAQAQTSRERYAAWLRDPVELTAGIVLESLPPSVLGVVAGTAVAGPGLGTAAGIGLSSQAMTFASELLNEAEKAGYRTRDPNRLEAFLQDEAAFDSAMRTALVKSGVVGAVDAATAGMAGRFIGPALRQGLRQRVVASGKELLLQAAGGAGGEAAGQIASGQPLDWFDIGMEGIAEIGSGPVEVAGNLAGRRETVTRPQAQDIRQRVIRKPISEFGGLREVLPGTGAAEAVPAAETSAPPATAPASPSAEPAPGSAPAGAKAVARQESEVMTDAVQGQKGKEGTEVSETGTTPPVREAGGEPGAATPPTPEKAAGEGGTPTRPVVSAILKDSLDQAVRRRESFPASWLDKVNVGRDVPYALPEGYRREGDQYVYQAPVKPETAAERMAREQREAMAALRQAKAQKEKEPASAEAKATEPVTKPPQRTPLVEPGVPVEVFDELPPDILDEIEARVTRGKVRFPKEFKDYVQRARGKAREMISVTEGEPADTVLDGLHREGVGRRLETLDDLADAIVRAGESRIGERKARAAAKRKLAKLEKEELARSKARQTAAAGPEIEVDENNDFLAPLIKQLGGPDPDDLRFAPAELREGGRQGKVGSDETRAIQGRQQPGTTAGRELAGEGVGTEQGQPVSGPAGTVRPASAEARARLAQEVEGKLDRLYSRALGRKKEDAARGMASAWRDFHEALKGGEPLADVLARVNRAMQVALNTSRQPAVVTLPKGVDRATGRIEQEKVRLYGREPLDFARGRYLGLRFYRDAILAQARERFAPGDTTQPAPQGQAEVRRAEAAINEFLGTEKLPDRVRVVYEPGAPYAGYYQGGRVVVNAARTSDPVRVLLEEGLHGVVAAIRDGELNDPGLLAALNEFADKVTAADVAREQARRKGLDTRAEVLAEEATIAKVLDENPGLIERLVRAIREAFRRWFGLELPAGSRDRIIQAAREYLRSQNQSLPGKRVVARNAIITFPGMGAYRYAVTAYHGTPHKVDRFTTKRIGSGEGEQVYGWGLYFAEEREVAERYRKALAEASLVDASGNTVEPRTEEERNAARLIHNRHHAALILGEQIDGVQITLGALENTKQYLGVAIARADENVIKYLTKVVGILEQWANRGVVLVTKGNIYTVSLNIEPDKLLHWDKPLNEQSEYVQNALRKVASELPNDNWRKNWYDIPYEKHTGEEFYHAWRIWCELEPKQISALLEQAGIQGIRYLDAESRTRGKGTYNYVIFDESRIQILAENGQPVSAAEASGAPADIRFAPAEEVPEGMGRRATGEKILGSTAVSNQTKQAITEYLYQKRTLAVDDNFAAGLIQRVGLDQAEAVVRSRPEDVPGAVWSRLLRGVTRELARREREAPLEQKAEWAQRQAQLWNTVLPQITDVAQTLRALEDAVEMSPDAQVERARMEIERANGERLERRRPETDQMQQALDEGRQTGLEAVRQDPEVNARARAAVDAAVAASDETHRAIIMELAEPWAQSSYVLAHAREAVRAKANELLNRAPRPPGLTPSQHLRQILDDLASRAAGIAAAHFQGAEPGVTLAEKLQARLGLDKAHAERLARQLDAEFERQVKAAKAKLSKRIAQARARMQVRREENLRQLQTDTGLDRAIKRQLRELNLKLGEVIRQAAQQRDEAGRHIADRVVAEAGLAGPEAEALKATLRRRWNELVGEAQRRALAAIEKRSGVRVGRTLKNAFDKLVELDRLGALTGTQFLDVVKKALKLQRLTEADARELRRLVKLAQEKPEGWQRQRAMANVITFVEDLKGERSWWDAALSIWYANIFSGPMTHARNMLGNGMKLLETLAVELLHRPVAAPQILRAVGYGMLKGALESASILRTGRVEGTRMLKLEAMTPLEAKRLPGNWDYLLTFWRLVGRAMASEDMVPFKTHEEIRWAMVARRVARREGLPMWGRRLNARVQELMHNTRQDWESAKVQAAREGLTGLDLLRRANEIIEQRREARLPGSLETARQFALKQTYNANPYGLLGSISEVLNHMNRSLVVTRFLVPVVRIVANLANESLNYFPPVGLARVALTRWGPAEVKLFGKRMAFRNRIDGKPITDPDAMFHQTAVAATGTVLFAALAWAVGRSVDDEDPPLAVYGQGPRDRAPREQLRKTGWMPNSIKVGGRYYSYQESPLAIPLGLLGNYTDALRWKNLDREDALNRFAYGAQTFASTFLDRGMLSGIASMLDALSSSGQAGPQLARAIARPGTSLVVPNALRFVDNVFDPRLYETDDVQGALLAQIPWARRLGRPALNAFGEAVERQPLEQFAPPAKPDALVKLLASKSAWVPMPRLDEQTVGNAEWGNDWLRPMTPDEYYQWIATSGPEIRQRLTYEMDRIRDMTDEEARAFVRKVASEERRRAKREFQY